LTAATLAVELAYPFFFFLFFVFLSEKILMIDVVLFDGSAHFDEAFWKPEKQVSARKGIGYQIDNIPISSYYF
jgi:hypothetical protein